MHSHDGKADVGADEELLFVGLEHVQRLFVGKIRVIDDVDAVANTHFDGLGTARVSIHPPAMGMDGLGHRGDLGFGHQGVRVPAVGHPDVAGDHHLDTVDAFADQLARDPAKLVSPSATSPRDSRKGFEQWSPRGTVNGGAGGKEVGQRESARTQPAPNAESSTPEPFGISRNCIRLRRTAIRDAHHFSGWVRENAQSLSYNSSSSVSKIFVRSVLSSDVMASSRFFRTASCFAFWALRLSFSL